VEDVLRDELKVKEVPKVSLESDFLSADCDDFGPPAPFNYTLFNSFV